MRKTGFLAVDEWPGWIVGADEAGWGAMAGPLVVAAAAAPVSWVDPRISDSKVLSPQKREKLFAEYRKRTQEHCIRVAVVPAKVVDEKGPQRARIEAFQEVLKEAADMCPEPPLLVVDGNLTLSVGHPLEAYPKADLKVPEVGLASIVAKVVRDTLMVRLGKEYPQYNWAKNKGYVTVDHKALLEEHGPCPEHRRSYGPVAEIVSRRSHIDLATVLESV